MKPFFVFVLLVCLGFPCFSQNSKYSERFNNLSEAMGRTLDNGKSNLENYDQDTSDSENMKTYIRYRRRYESLSSAMKDSEARMDRLLRTNDKPARIKDERDNYEKLVNNLQSTKSDYDSWMRSVR